MAKKVKIDWDDARLQAAASGPAYEAALRPIAEEIVERARTLAPRATGTYANSLYVTTPREQGYYKTGRRAQKVRAGARRAGLTGDSVYIGSSDMKSHWIEFGSIKMTAYAPVRTAASQLYPQQFEAIPKGGE
jgi:hypothetical protein